MEELHTITKRKLIESRKDPSTRIVVTEDKLQPRLLDYVFSNMNSTRFTLKESLIFLKECQTSNRATHVVVRSADGKVVINVFGRRPSDIPPVLLLQRVVRRIYVAMNVLDIDKHKMVYWLVPCKDARWFPKRGMVLPKHINGGYTTVSRGQNTDAVSVSEIFVYRYQEFPKVMLHEMLHHSRVDNHNMSNIDVMRLKNLCKIDPSTIFLPNEAIVETWAIIMHTLFVAIELGVPLNILLDKEKEWSDKQSQRIISFISPDRPWKEKSNAYCYVVLKAALLYDANAFISASLRSDNIMHYIENAIQSPNYIRRRNSRKHMKSESFRMSVFGDL
jgi:hypothetical protein